VAKKDALLKQIDQIEGKLKFFRNALLALISAIVWSAYAIIENKVGIEISIFAFIGIIVMIVVFIRVKLLEIKENELIKQLEKE
jgi:hypothetical protein